jgi:hypothetical protein
MKELNFRAQDEAPPDVSNNPIKLTPETILQRIAQERPLEYGSAGLREHDAFVNGYNSCLERIQKML